MSSSFQRYLLQKSILCISFNLFRWNFLAGISYEIIDFINFLPKKYLLNWNSAENSRPKVFYKIDSLGQSHDFWIYNYNTSVIISGFKIEGTIFIF
jgi:hypothetical protein